MAIWILLCTGWILAAAVFFFFLLRSPVGYEDQAGFHLGYPPGYFPPEQVERVRLAFERAQSEEDQSLEGWVRMVELRAEVAALLESASVA
ncbi:MAG TPA: hypothetical protein VL094_02490 [Sphingomonadaceae bacterium]|nr:hypothetical protein [Sphingomonadaceae bacterium]